MLGGCADGRRFDSTFLLENRGMWFVDTVFSFCRTLHEFCIGKNCSLSNHQFTCQTKTKRTTRSQRLRTTTLTPISSQYRLTAKHVLLISYAFSKDLVNDSKTGSILFKKILEKENIDREKNKHTFVHGWLKV